MSRFSKVLFTILIYSLFSSFSFGQNILKIKRFDKDFLSYMNAPAQEKNNIESNYPSFLPALAQTIVGEDNKDEALKKLTEYYSHPMLKSLYTDVVYKYNDLSNYEIELTSMCDRATQLLNIQQLPSFCVHVSGLKANAIYIDNTISLSLDKYMGLDFPAYQGYFTPHQMQQMQSSMIIRDYARAWLMADYIKIDTSNGNLESEMIEAGKLFYTLSLLLPNYTEQDLLGYSLNEYNWIKENDKKIWNHILKQNHLNSTDLQIIRLYLENTSSNKLPFLNAPANVGYWIGFQIVKQYIKEYKPSISELLNTDNQLILKNSKYKP